jgi:hypothetical protein
LTQTKRCYNMKTQKTGQKLTSSRPRFCSTKKKARDFMSKSQKRSSSQSLKLTLKSSETTLLPSINKLLTK